MTKNLVIVESPAKAKTISKFLGGDYEIKASYGHVRDLPEYTLGIDLKQHFEPKYQVLKDKAKLIKDLKKISKTAEHVYIATDPDREGEAIAWHIKESMELPDEKVRRIVFHEITKTAIQSAIGHSRQIDSDLVDAQQARRILDRLIGYKLSPILAKKIRKGLSAGRVQSVAVKLVCDRDKAIADFVPEEYWVLDAKFTRGKDKLVSRLFALNSEKNKIEPKNEAEAVALYDALVTADYSVSDLKKTTQNRYPQPPFITSTLQQDASRKLNWSTKKTMMVAQQLYEGVDIGNDTVGLITYMRTDSFRIADEARVAAKGYIQNRYGDRYIPEKPPAYRNKNNTQDAHEAIRPTYMDRPPESVQGKLTPDLFKLYKLIWDRFVASQMVPAQVENTTVIVAGKVANGDRYLFKTTGQVVLFDGFTTVYTEATDDESDEEGGSRMPVLNQGEPLKLDTLNREQKFTQPPHHFNEATLVKELEECGIGRPSTYAPTIATIVDRGYVKKEKKTLLATELGIITNSKLSEFFSGIIDTEFTAAMETRLDEIMEGKHVWKNVVEEIYTPFVSMLKRAETEMEKVNTDRPSDEVCEKCGSPMVIKTGRFGEFTACSNYPACKNTKSMRKELEIPCPECGGKILEKKSKRGKMFFGCENYPKCTFALWDRPVAEACPSCQYPLLVVKNQRGKNEQKSCPKCHQTVS